MKTEEPVLSRRSIRKVEGRRAIYDVAPLTIRERAAYRADMAGEGCRLPMRAELLEGLASAMKELAPDNLADLLAVIARAEAAQGDGADPMAKADEDALRVMESAARQVPAYAAMLADQVRWFSMMPLVTARHALRGWNSDLLPPFQRLRGLVPDELLEECGEEDLSIIAAAAIDMMQVTKAQEKN
jgi:hypothetical protein